LLNITPTGIDKITETITSKQGQTAMSTLREWRQTKNRSEASPPTFSSDISAYKWLTYDDGVSWLGHHHKLLQIFPDGTWLEPQHDRMVCAEMLTVSLESDLWYDNGQVIEISQCRGGRAARVGAQLYRAKLVLIWPHASTLHYHGRHACALWRSDRLLRWRSPVETVTERAGLPEASVSSFEQYTGLCVSESGGASLNRCQALTWPADRGQVLICTKAGGGEAPAPALASETLVGLTTAKAPLGSTFTLGYVGLQWSPRLFEPSFW